MRIGVKAGSDGFPAIGGTEEVTHGGVCDDTRDFASGGENPPHINDPGEFVELRGALVASSPRQPTRSPRCMEATVRRLLLKRVDQLCRQGLAAARR